MNVVKKSLIGLGLVAVLAGCSGTKTKEVNANAPAAGDQVEVASGQANATTDKAPAATEVLSTVNVKLLDGKVELSDKETASGELEFNVRNETAEPLNVSVIKTDIDPVSIKVEEGKVDSTQEGLEVFSESQDREVMAGKDVVIKETLAPGGYYVVVTSAGKTEPVAFSALTVTPQ